MSLPKLSHGIGTKAANCPTQDVTEYRDRRRRGGDRGRRGRGLRRRGDGVRRRGAYLGTGDRRRGDRLRLGGDLLRRAANTRGGVRRLGGGDLRDTRRGDECDLLLLHQCQSHPQSLPGSYKSKRI